MMYHHPWKKKVIGIKIIGLAFLLGLVLLVMLLWNALMPDILGLSAIGFLQAAGLLLLCRILFGGFAHHRFGRHHARSGLCGHWHSMSPEEREAFTRKRWSGFWPHREGGDFPDREKTNSFSKKETENKKDDKPSGKQE